MKIKIISDVKQIQRRLEKLKNMHDSTFLTGKIAHDMKKEVALNFRKEQSPDGVSWARLKGSTIIGRYTSLRFANKKGKGKAKIVSKSTGGRTGRAKILQDTGTLRNSISISNNREKAIIGTNLIYSRTHQFGLPKKNVPARPYMGLSQKQKERYREWIKRWKRGELG